MSGLPFETAARSPPARDVFTVSRLNQEARVLLERGLGSVWLEAEISNLSRPASGHWYFLLKDAGAQVRCAMFRTRNQLVRFQVRVGLAVLVRARVCLYEPRGEFQLVIDHLEEAGEGALRRRFEELKQKLNAEGLFATSRKRALPRLPRRVGVITSPSGAAIRDILHVLERRFPAIPVLVYPVPVQSDVAPAAICAALRLAGARHDCDVLILARGGGSLEDLWAFNDEGVARAIAACPLPIVSGIGHEVDVTIADFVADERAPTPSAAAERAVPDCAEWLRAGAALGSRLATAMRRRLQSGSAELKFRSERLARVHPGVRLRHHAQRLDELETRTTRALRSRLNEARGRLRTAETLLARASPERRVAALVQRVAAQTRALENAGRLLVARSRTRFDGCLRTLHAVSPLATLDRGYAIVHDAAGHVLQDASGVASGAKIEARLARGKLAATVPQVVSDAEDPHR
jgi:exodeoxyribonuclease VII large subunit